MSWIRAHWRRVSTAALLLTVAGLGAHELYRAKYGDCCAPGAACCHPGSPCCHGHGAAQASR
jgi:hypothetical protein